MLRTLRRALAPAAFLALSLAAHAPARADQPDAAPAPAAEPRPSALPATVERWYVLHLQGQRAGHMVSREVTAGDTITSTSDVSLTIKRDKLAISIAMSTGFEETRDGQPLRLTSTSKLGAMETRKEIVFLPGNQVRVTTTQATPPPGAPIVNTETRPGPGTDWLPPAAAARYVQQQLAQGATTMKLRTLDPAMGESPIELTRTILERATVEAFGRTVPAVKWKTAVDILPGTDLVEFVDEQGETVRSEVNLGGIVLVQTAADKELALSRLDAPELLASTLVTPSRPITSPRTLRRATYTVRSTKGDLPDLPSLVGQTFTRTGPTRARVEVLAGAPGSAHDGSQLVPRDQADAVRVEHLRASPMLDTADPELQRLAKGIDLTTTQGLESAEKLRRFVHAFINSKDMSVGFATASEVGRTRTGDCTEHAVLLAALLRARGIPARVASGLIYVDAFAGQQGVFGYHMWTQALVDTDAGPAWVNLDATLPDEHPRDATHITLSVSSLNDGQVQNFLVTTAPLIGKLAIDVEETKSN
jgi:transglutaminase-like putative cysteine protease